MSESSTAQTMEQPTKRMQKTEYMRLYRARKKLGETKPTKLQPILDKLTETTNSFQTAVEQVNKAQKQIDEFRTNRANIFSALQQRILDSISDADIEKASLRDKSWTLAVIYDKERIETGKSTSNVLHGGKIVLIPSGMNTDQWNENSVKLLSQKQDENPPTNDVA